MTLASQAATVALAAIGVAAFVFGIPGTGSEKVELPEVAIDPIQRPQVTQRAATPDVAAVADRFSTIANAPKPPPPVVADTTPGGTAPTVPVAPPPPPDNIKYLGHVGLGSTLFAMISENQRQSMVGINDELSSGRVVEITPNELTLDRDGTRKVIELSAKSGSAISTVMPLSATNTRGIRGGPRSQLNPQDIMSRSRQTPSAPPQIVNLNGPEQRRQQAWDEHFNTATNRLLESGRYKDEGEAKQAAARYAEEMVKVEEEIIQGADPEEIEKRRKDLDQMFESGGSK